MIWYYLSNQKDNVGHLDVSDEALHDPLPLLLAVEVEAGKLLLLAEDEVVGADHQEVAVHLLVDLLLHSDK